MSDPHFSASPIRHPLVWVRNKFLAGLAIVIPLVVTFWILRLVYDFIRGLSQPLLESFAGLYNQTMPDPNLHVDIASPHFSQFVSLVGFLIPMGLVVALGVMATNVIGVRVVSAMDKLLLSIPVISFIYKSLKQVIEAFRGFGGTRSFKRVVYVDYPSPGMKLIGFVTGQYDDPKTKKNMSCVFLPGALSPMTGLLIVTETSRLEDAPLSIEDAMKMIFSGGLIGPSSEEEQKAKAARKPKSSKHSEARPQVAQNPDFAHLPTAEDSLDTFVDPPTSGAGGSAAPDKPVLVGAGNRER
ncbi:putative membrane protein [Roseimicrobium gellanilyticum]|uniref:Putative membrane protein n=1 Tax=Roseimicrobium gellanilyticum TaxID=748857 RepID=A0A366HTR9_9BACT|nr:DUF502 domain-containing protein [Roseimicrobium gellanilyticum]RBP47683.1 putative membrane protein [Roseimicrobium gellanilyticum]